MKKVNVFLVLLSLCISSLLYAQNKTEKKVAVVSFSTDKTVDVTDLGLNGVKAVADKILDLKNDPNFNLAPILEKYHTAFFDSYSKKFPFTLLPEDKVTNNQAYKDFQPKVGEKENETVFSLLNYPGYKEIYEGMFGKSNEEGMATIFKDQADGVMMTRIHFSLVKGFGIGGTATVKMKVYARIALYDKTGKKVWVINESEQSKKTGIMVKGIPVLEPSKILPMCESALEELMKDLDNRIEKIVKKSEKL
jgi:hypothetical protein